MKKFLAIGLAFVMFTTMLAFSAGAVKEVGGEKRRW